MPGNRAASALARVTAPKTASPAVLRERACEKAVTPGTSTAASLAISVVRQLPVILSCSAAMFQMPVATRTAKAGQAIWLNRRAAARVTWVPGRRSTATSAVSVSWPPNQMVAVQDSLSVPELTVSIRAAVLPPGHRGRDVAHDGGAWAGPFRAGVVPACRPIVPGDLASRPARDAGF